MRASVKLLASVVLSLGLATTAFAHSTIDFRDMNGTLIAGRKAAAKMPNALVFSGDFAGPVSWTLTTLSNGTQNFTLTGVLTGMTGGAAINATAMQLIVNLDRAPEGATTISSETTREDSVPEPSTFALLGSGSLTLLGALRRRNGRNC